MANHLEYTLQKVTVVYNEQIEELLDIWNELGHDECVIKERCNTIITHSNDLLNAMIEESQKERASIFDSIQNSMKKIKLLRHRLGIMGPMEGYEDTPFVLLVPELQKKVQEYENLVLSRMKHINQLLHEENKLCITLGIAPKQLQTNPLPSENQLHDFQRYIEALKQQIFNLEEEFIQIKCDITKMLKDLSKTPSLDFERDVIHLDEKDFLITDDNMHKLRQWLKSLKKEVQERKDLINELQNKLLSIWEFMDVNTEYRSQFINEIQGIGEEMVLKLRNEISRCETQKKAHIKTFIDKYRRDIEEWWEKCLYGNNQKSDFMTLFKSDCYTEDLLALHELQLEKLKLYYAENKKIFDLLKKRDQLWQRTIYLSEQANCPDRFKNRGGKLLKEEKERKEVNLQIPQIEKILLEETKNYKITHQIDFRINDKNLEDVFLEDLAKFKENQNSKLLAKKKARDLTMTPKQVTSATNTPKTVINTPNSTTTKRKANIPLIIVTNCDGDSEVLFKRSKITTLSPHATTSKVNNQTAGKVSYCVRRRLCPTKRLSKDGSFRKQNRKFNHTSIDSDEFYKKFKRGITNRSSVFPIQNENHFKTPQKTPRKRSPHTPHTPSTNRLQAASPLPLLF